MKAVTVLLATLVLVFASNQVQAQDADYTGSWVLSLADSDFGYTRAPQAAELEIRRADSQLAITSSRDFGTGPESVEIEIPIDGSRHSVETPRGSMLISAEWDEEVLVIWRQAQANVGEVEITERHHLQDEGERLRVVSSIEVPGTGAFEATMVFLRSDE